VAREPDSITLADEDDAPLAMARAVILYLAHRSDELDEDPLELLRLAARAEFDGHPPRSCGRLVEQPGVAV
jgi:hypothetical protein